MMVLWKKTEGGGGKYSWLYMRSNYAASCTALLLPNSMLCCEVAVENVARTLKHAFFLLYHLFIRINSSNALFIAITKNGLGA